MDPQTNVSVLRSPGATIAVLSATGVIVSLQQTMLIPLLPQLPGLLNTSADNATWLVTVTVLTGAVSIPSLSRLADMHGKERVILVALAATVLGSVLGALTRDFAVVLIARGLQGIGLALVPIGMAIMRDRLPARRVSVGIALMSATVAFGGVAGLVAGGVIVERFDWHAIFWVTGLVGALLMAMVALVLERDHGSESGRFDYLGAALVTVGLTAVLTALSKAGTWGWTSGPTIGVLCLGGVVLAIWVPLSLRMTAPIVDVRAATRGSVLTANLCSLLCGFATFANMLVTTQYLQHPGSDESGIALDAMQSGLWMVPGAAALGVAAPLSAWLINRHSPRLTLCVGAILMAVIYLVRGFASDELWQVVLGSVLVGCATSITYTALPAWILEDSPPSSRASANGLNTLMRYTGTAAASAVLGALAAASSVMVGQDSFPTLRALSVMCWLAAAASLVAFVLAALTHRQPRGLASATSDSARVPPAVTDDPLTAM